MTSQLIRNLEDLPSMLMSYLNNYRLMQFGNVEATRQAEWMADDIQRILNNIPNPYHRALLVEYVRQLQLSIIDFAERLKIVLDEEKDKSNEN